MTSKTIRENLQALPKQYSFSLMYIKTKQSQVRAPTEGGVTPAKGGELISLKVTFRIHI